MLGKSFLKGVRGNNFTKMFPRKKNNIIKKLFKRLAVVEDKSAVKEQNILTVKLDKSVK